MNGTTLPMMSSDGKPGYPAPETACSVVTMADRSPNWRNGASAIVSTTVEQLGLVTIPPRHPWARAWAGKSPK